MIGDKLRSVLIDNRWKLETFEQHGQIDYDFRDTTTGKVVMHGAVGPPDTDTWDSDDTLRSCMTWITLREGDVGEEYFWDYSQYQVEWMEEHAEHLSSWSDRELALPWEDLDDED